MEGDEGWQPRVHERYIVVRFGRCGVLRRREVPVCTSLKLGSCWDEGRGGKRHKMSTRPIKTKLDK